MSSQWSLILGGLCAAGLFGWLGYSAIAERARRKVEREQAAQTAARAAQTARRRAKRRAAAIAESTRAALEKERAAVEQVEANANARIRQAEDEAAAARLVVESAAKAEAQAIATCAPPPSPTDFAPKSPEQTLILIADDSKLVRYKTGRLLEQHQYQVSLAIDGLDAVRQMRASAPDVVITDVEMPGMDGFELARHIRSDPRTANVPIIMISAAEDKHRESADSAGVSALFGKPYVDADLVGFIRSAMRQDVVH